MSSPYTAPTRRRVAPLLSIPVVVAVVAGGVWLTGGVISNDYRTSMALTGVWFAVSAAACVAIGLRYRRLRLPVLGAYLATAVLIGGYLGLSTVHDRVADERVVTASVPPQSAPAPGRAERRNVQLASGRFRSHEHETSGRANVVRVRDGRRFLTLTNFATSAGPDLRVRLVPGDTSDGGAAGSIDLGALKGNRGDQQYELPRRAVLAGRTVVIWCRAFSAPFGSAPLRAA